MSAPTIDAPVFDQERYDEGRYEGVIETLDRTGDTKVMWDSRNEDEVASAKAAFDTHIKRGGLAYKAEGKTGERGEKITKFDKKAERIILVPQLVGG